MFDFKTQSGLIRLLGALVILFCLLWILRSLTLLFQKDYFLSTDYTVDCATGLIKPTGSAPAIPAADQPGNGGTRYQFTSGNIVDTITTAGVVVGNLPITCKNYVWSKWNAGTSSYGPTLTWQAAPTSPFAAGGGTDSQFSMNGTTPDPTMTASTTTTASASGTTTVSPAAAAATPAATSAATPAATPAASVPTTSAALSAANAPLGTAAGAGTGSSLHMTTASGLIPSLTNCKQYYNVGWN